METADDGTTSGPPDGENVLVLAPAMGSTDDEQCAHIAGDADDLLVVSLSDAPDHRVDTISARAGRPDTISSISCDTTRGAAAARPTTNDPNRRSVTVSGPGDLTGLGMHIDRYLSTAAPGTDVSVCVDSLTTLLQYSGPKAVFRFCHSVTRKSSVAGATTHFHLDPSTVDDRTLHTLQSLFDRTVEV